MITRDIYPKISESLSQPEILLFVGARQTGKTTLLNCIQGDLQAQNQVVHSLTLEDPRILELLNQHPEKLFDWIPKKSDIRQFVLIDEVQYLDNPSNFLKYHYDLYHDQLKLIVTGSSAFYIDQKFKDSLAGRKRIFQIKPFGFREFLKAHNRLDLLETVSRFSKDAFEKRSFLIPQKVALQQLIAEYMRYGGYPRVVLADDPEEKKRILRELAQSFLKKDFLEAGIRYEEKAYHLVALLASQAGQLVNQQELSNTLNISISAVENYIYILQKSYILQLIRPWFGNLRKELTKMPKVFFEDMGLRNAILNHFEPFENRMDKGALFENLFFQIVTQNPDLSVQFWRTQSHQEVDFILNGSAAFELKLTDRLFQSAKYQKFNQTYPQLHLQPVVMDSNTCLDILDFI